MSLRTRLLLALLGLVAAGLLVADWRRTALCARSCSSASTSNCARRADRSPWLWRYPDPGLRPDGRAGEPSLPPGTYGELRSTPAWCINTVSFIFGSRRPTAQLPRRFPAHRRRTPAATCSTGHRRRTARFRVLVQAVPSAQRILIVAVPLTETNQTLARLLASRRSSRARARRPGVAAWLLIKRDLRPLEAMAETADAIAAGDLSQRVEPAEPRTEVGRLGLSLNTMLAQIEEAFAERAATEEKLRRFLADASHELRTPLTSIRGYAELFEPRRQGRPRRPRHGHAPHRGGEQAHGRDGRRAAAAGAARRGPQARAGARRPGARRERRRRRRARRRRRSRDLARGARPSSS